MNNQTSSSQGYPTTWDFSPLFSSDNDPIMETKRKIIIQKTEEFSKKWKKNKEYLKDPRVLKEALDEYNEWMRTCGGAGDEEYYFYLRLAQDQSNNEIQAKFNKVSEVSRKMANELNFFNLSLSKISIKQQKVFLENSLLKDYKHYLEKCFLAAKHRLSDDEEKIITLKYASAHEAWVRMVSRLLDKEERVVYTENGKEEFQSFSHLFSLISNRDIKVRESATKAFNEILDKYKEVAEAEINAIIQDKKINDELCKFPRPDSARHLSDDIDTKIVDALIEAVASKFSVAQEYYNLKAQLMSVPKLKYNERNVPYGEIATKYSFDDSVKLVKKTLKNLDPTFEKFAEEMLKNGQLDVFPQKGKRSGAFCISGLHAQPIYVLLNHTEKLNDVTTFAHELGHAINNILIKQNQNAINLDTPLATAEVASTFMEDFVLQEIVKESNDELKLIINMEKLNGDISSIFRQIACYRFEQDLHKSIREKGYLSHEEIGKLFSKHMESYMGPAIEQSPGSENWWTYWHHIRTFFYNYSYASGLIISKALQKMVKEDPKNIEKVKQFLSSGSNVSPKEIFSSIGLDITHPEFWNVGLEEVEVLLKETKDLARKLGKIK